MTMCPYIKSYFVFALLIPGFAGQMIPRLVNGTAWSGRLEVFDNGKWKTICKPCFDDSDLMVVCRDLGFSSERAVSVRSDLYGEGSGSILRTEVSCTGYERRLSDCERGGVHHCEHWMDVGVICDSPGEMTPRLVNGAHWSGRLEVLEDGIWNTVCDREFGNNEAQVVCRMLGLNSPGAVSVTSDLFGEGSGSILSKRLKCTGTESKLSECQASGILTDSCNHPMDVGVICNIPGQLKARLVGGNTSSGRLEVLNNGTWGAMCDEDFGLQETQVACRMLGFDSDVTSLTHDNSSGTVFYGNVTCNGTEASLTDCQHGGFSPRDCQQSRAVSISCNVPPELTLRLVNGNPWSGRLEIFYHGKWRSMCDGSFGPKEAQVVCRMFGFDSPGAVRVYSVTYGRGSGTLRLANVSLLQCTHNGLRDEDCGHTDDIAVICNIREHFTPRLTGGNTWSGRLEILYSGTWSSVCDTSLGYKEARVGCRMLGFDSPDIFAVNSFVFGDRDSTVLFGDLDCQGTESSLVQCNYSSLYNNRCGAGRDIGLICKAQTGDFRLAGSHGNTYGVGRVEMRLESEWYSLCSTSFINDEAKVICRHLGFNSSTATTADVSLFGTTQGLVVMVDFNCSGNKANMFACLQKVENIPVLCDAQEFGVICGDYPPSVLRLTLNGEDTPSVTVTENSSVYMICEAHGRPTPRMLLVNGANNLVLKERPLDEVSSMGGRGTVVMIFEEVQCEDSADYRCEVDNGVGLSNKSIRLLVPCAPKIKRFDGRLPFMEIQNHQGHLTFQMTGYPTPQIKSKVRHGSTVNNSEERSSADDRIHVSCAARQFAPASVTCNITTVNVIQIDQSLYQIDFKNSLGETSFNFSRKRKDRTRKRATTAKELFKTVLLKFLLKNHAYGERC